MTWRGVVGCHHGPVAVWRRRGLVAVWCRHGPVVAGCRCGLVAGTAELLVAGRVAG